MEKRKILSHLRRPLVMLLTFTMVLSMVQFDGMQTAYAESTGGTNSTATSKRTNSVVAGRGMGSATTGVSERVADGNTMETYQDMLLSGGNSRYAGRLWADKSVFARSADGRTPASVRLTQKDDGIDNVTVTTDEDFLHVFSLLGSSQVVNEFTPADLVLALDISGSMGSSEENEVENWVYAAAQNAGYDKDNPYLGYYVGSGNSGQIGDSNGIPDRIEPIMPTGNNGYTGGNVSGQMSGSALTSYNAYLDFCNRLIGTLRPQYANIDGKTYEETDALIDAIPNDEILETVNDHVVGVDTYIKEEFRNAEGYKEIFKRYWHYVIDVREERKQELDPWISDAEKNHNALWPYAEWESWEGWTGEHNNPMQEAGNAPNRMYKMINAANEFIDDFLALNPKNRISVVVYDSVATVLMPLATYARAESGSYLSAKKHHWQSWSVGQWGCTVTANATPIAGFTNHEHGLTLNESYSASVTSWANTDTMCAINAGLDVLATSSNDYGDNQQRIPIMVLMTDGAANTVLTGGNMTNPPAASWTMGGTKSYTVSDQITQKYNQYDGFVLNNYKKTAGDTGTTARHYNILGDAFKDETSPNLTVYGAGDAHLYCTEDYREPVILQTLMSAAYQKTLVEKHYNGDISAQSTDWQRSMIYTIGYDTASYGNNFAEICLEILDPAKHFVAGNSAAQTTYTQYTNWLNDIGGNQTTMAKVGGGTSSIDGTSNGEATEVNFTLRQSDLDGKNVTKADIARNIGYNTGYFEATSDGTGNDIDRIFDQILQEIRQAVFAPVGGQNDAGARDSVTYTDPIGTYMEVKEVKSLLLFGEIHGVTRTAVYDWQWNDKWMDAHASESQELTSFPGGWYKEDLEPEDPQNTARDNVSWNDGYVYRVGYDIAKQFLPTLLDAETTEPGDAEDKLKNTVYTFYRLDKSTEERGTWYVNPAFAANFTSTEEDSVHGYYDPETMKVCDEYQTQLTEIADKGADGTVPTGVYRLSDIRIWVEDSGDYIYEGGNIQGGGFDEALRVDVPVSAMPTELAIINALEKKDAADQISVEYSYSTNLGSNAAKPLRVFYSVGIEDDVKMLDSGNIDVSLLDDTYVSSHTQNAGGSSRIWFISNYYTEGKDGDASITFSPSVANRFYVFQKNLALYTVDGEADPSEKFVVSEDTSKVNTLENIHVDMGGGETVTLKPITTNVTSDGTYYIIGEYYKPSAELASDNNPKAEHIYFVAKRKGSDFGSGVVEGDSVEAGAYLSWYNPATGEAVNYMNASNTAAEPNPGGCVVAAKVGGFRAGNLEPKTKSANTTNTSSRYYAPMVSNTTSGEGLSDGLVMNLYLGNNGRLQLDDSRLLVTKRVANKPNAEAPDEGFKYQVFVDDDVIFTGVVNAIKVRYDTYSGLWRQRISKIEALTDNVGFLLGANDQRVRCDEDGKIQEDGKYYIYLGNESTNLEIFRTNDDTDEIEKGDVTIYYDSTLVDKPEDVKEPANKEHGDIKLTYLEADDLHSAGTREYRVEAELFKADAVDTAGSEWSYSEPGVKKSIQIAQMKLDQDMGLRSGVNITSDAQIRTSYLTVALQVGQHEDGKEITKEGLYDQTSFQNPRAASEIHTAEKICSGTVEFTLKDGEGLQFVGIGMGSDYRVTEKIETDQANAGYGLLRARIVQYQNFVDYVVSDNGDNIGPVSQTHGTREAGNAFMDGYYKFTNSESSGGSGGKISSVGPVDGAIPNNCAYFDANAGFYSLYGDTANLEEAVHYINYAPEVHKTEPTPGDQKTVEVGDEIDYVIKWQNQEQTGTPIAPAAAKVVITDQLDPGVTFVSAGYDPDRAWDSDTGYKDKDSDNNTLLTAGQTSVFKPETDWENPKVGDVEIAYNKNTHTVTWTIYAAPKQMGTVELKVEVNENAPDLWEYDDAPTTGEANTPRPIALSGNDYQVLNRAEVKVANHYTQRTETMRNPLGNPDKTETLIERGETAKKNGYTSDVPVSETGDDANLLPREDGKWHGPRVFVGDKITYTIEWHNYKSEDATISISDRLDENVRFVSAEYDPTTFESSAGEAPLPDLNPKDKQTLTNVQVAYGQTATNQKVGGYVTGDAERNTITYNGAVDCNGGTVTWNLGKMPAGSSGTVTLVVEVRDTAEAVGYVDNTARVQVGNDPELETKTVENPIPILEKTETKPGSDKPVRVGDVIEYQITCRNHKSEDAYVLLMDTLDPGVDYIEPADGTYESYKEGNVDKEKIYTIKDKDGNLITITYYPNAVTNKVYTGTIGGQEVKVTVDEIPAHTIVWDLGVQSPNAGDAVTFSVRVNENAKYDYNYNENADGFVPAPGAASQNDYEVLNQARMRLTNDPYELTEQVENPVPEKTETNPGSGQLVEVGQEITYEISWANTKEQPVAIEITDPLDIGVDFVSAVYGNNIKSLQAKGKDSVDTGDAAGNVNRKPTIRYDAGSRSVIWTFQADANSSGEVTLTVKVNENAVKTWTYNSTNVADTVVAGGTEGTGKDYEVLNRAKVKIDNDVIYTVEIQNPVPEKTETEIERGGTVIDNNPSLTPKENVEGNESNTLVGPEVYVGDVVTYKIHWKNGLNASEFVTIEDPLDPGVDFVSASIGNTSIGEVSLKGTVDNNGTFAPDTGSDGKGSVTLSGINEESVSVPVQISYTQDSNGAVTIKWQIGKEGETLVPAGADGDVELLVKVTTKALKDLDRDGNGTIDNQAMVQLNNESKVSTEKIENKTPTGALEISKTVNNGTRVSPENGFTFNVQFKSEINKDSITITKFSGSTRTNIDPSKISNGILTFQLKDKEKVQIKGLPVGTSYTVKETTVDGFVTSVKVDGSVEKTTEYSGTISEGTDIHTVAFTNDGVPEPEKEETKPGEDKLVTVGQEITYTIHWVNKWNETGDVVVTDRLDKGLDFVSADEGGVYDSASHTVTWIFKDREPGAQGSVTLVGKVNKNAVQSWKYGEPLEDQYGNPIEDGSKDYLVRNLAKVEVNNNSSFTFEVDNPVIEKRETSPGAGEVVEVGQKIDYEIHWTNSHNDTATVKIVDRLDKGVNFVSAGFGEGAERTLLEADPNGGNITAESDAESADGKNKKITIEYNAATHTVTWTLRDREAKEPGTVALRVEVNENALRQGKVENQASVQVDNDDEVLTELIPNPTGPSKTETYINEEEIKDKLDKLNSDRVGDHYSGPAVDVEDEITYQITWVNNARNGEELLKANVIVTDPLDNGVDFVSAAFGNVELEAGQNGGDVSKQSADGKIKVEYKESTRTVVWTLNDREAGEAGTVTLKVCVNQEAYKKWQYGTDAGSEDTPVRDDSARDDEIVDRAKVNVSVENNPSVNTEVYTETIHNPLNMGNLKLEKKVVPIQGGTIDEKQPFTFQIQLQDQDAKPLDLKIAYTIFTKDGKSDKRTTSAGQEKVEVVLKNGENVLFEKLPVGTKYVIEEIQQNGYLVAQSGIAPLPANTDPEAVGSYKVEGSITEADQTVAVEYINRQLTTNHKEELTPGENQMVKVGDVVSYRIDWINDQNTAATVTVTDPLDKGVDFVSASFVEGTEEIHLEADSNGGSVTAESADGSKKITIKYDADNHTVTWTLKDRQAGKGGAVALTVKVNDNAVKTWRYEENSDETIGWPNDLGKDFKIQNRAKVEIGDHSHYTNKVENPVPEKTETNPGNGLLVGVGKEITYEIGWANTKEDQAVVEITDPLDQGVDFVSASFGMGEGSVTLTKEENETMTAGENVSDYLQAKNADGSVVIKYNVKTHTVTWTFQADKNTSGSVTLTVKVNENAVTTWTYDSTTGVADDKVAGGQPGTGTDDMVRNRAKVKVDNEAAYTVEVQNPVPEKTEEKPGEKEIVGIGDEITYHVRWFNDEDKPAKVVVTDLLDDGVDFVSASFGTGEGSVTLTGVGSATNEEKTITVEYDGKTVTWTMLNVPERSGGTVDLVVKVNENAVKVWSYGTGDTPDVDETSKDHKVFNRAKVEVGNRSAYTNTVENPVPEKTESTPGAGSLVGVGDSITYEIYWENGKDEEALVEITDPLDFGVDFASAAYNKKITLEANDKNSVDTGDGDQSADKAPTIRYDAKTHTVIWTFQAAANTSGSVTLTVKVNKNAVKTWTYESTDGVKDDEVAGGKEGTGKDYEVLNRAKVKVDNEAVYTAEVQNPVPEKTESTPGAGELVDVGSRIEYAVRWTNGHDEAAYVVVLDTLDRSVDYLEGDPVNAGSTYYPEGGTLTYTVGEKQRTITIPARTVVWDLKEQSAGAFGLVTLAVAVNEKVEVHGKVENQASVVVGNDGEVWTEIIENPTDSMKSETMVNDKDVSDSLTEEEDGVHGPKVKVGDTITYEINWVNNAKDAEGKLVPAVVTVRDPLDVGLDFVSADNGGVYDSATHTVVWNMGEQSAGAYGTLTLVVKVNQEAYHLWQYGVGGGLETSDVRNDDEVINRAEVGVKVENQPEVTTYTEVIHNPLGTGDLKITKTVTGGAGDQAAEFTFVVTLTDANGKPLQEAYAYAYAESQENGAGDGGEADDTNDRVDGRLTSGGAIVLHGGQSVTIRDIPEGTKYEVTEQEANQNNYITTITGGTGVIADENLVTAAFTNHRAGDVGVHLELTKTLVDANDGGYTLKAGMFSFLVTPADDNPGSDPIRGAFKVTHGGSRDGKTAGAVLFDDVRYDAAGSYRYTVREEIPASGMPGMQFDTNSYTVTVSITGAEEEMLAARVDIVDKDGKAVDAIRFTNTFTTAASAVLQTQKELVGGTLTKGEFTFELEGVSAVYDDVSGGDASGGDVSGGNVSGGNVSGGDVSGGEVSGNGAAGGKNNQSGAANGRETRSGAAGGALLGGLIGMNKGMTDHLETEAVVELLTAAQNGTKPPMPAGGTVCTNEADGYASFGTITYTRPGVYSYRITERNDEKVGVIYDETVYTVTVVVTRNEENGLLEARTTYSGGRSDEIARFVNEMIKGSLTVTKTVTGADGDREKLFHFQVKLGDVGVSGQYGDMNFVDGVAEFTLKHGQSLTAAGLPAGVTYEVIEKEAGADGYDTTTDNAAGTIPENGTVVAMFRNHKEVEKPEPKTGNLTVTKTVTGNDSDTAKEFHFRVELSDTEISGQYGDLYFRQGAAEFTLKHGESMTARNLPVDVAYKVTEVEANQDGYHTEAVGDTGTIADGATSTAAFVNDRNRPEEPSEPSEPEEPSEPSEPSKPEEPSEPSEPSKPEEPSEPSEPSKPEEPSESSEPEEPSELEEPSEPGVPDIPVVLETPPTSPKTGDESNLGLWLALLMASLFGVTVSALNLQRRRSDRNRGKHSGKGRGQRRK